MRQKGYKAAVKSFLNLATGRLGHPRKDPRIRGTYPFQWVWPAYVEAPLDKDPDVVAVTIEEGVYSLNDPDFEHRDKTVNPDVA